MVGCYEDKTTEKAKWTPLIYALSEENKDACDAACIADAKCSFTGTSTGPDVCYLGAYDLDDAGVVATTDPINTNNPKISFNDGTYLS